MDQPTGNIRIDLQTAIDQMREEIEEQLQSPTVDPEMRVLYEQVLPTHRNIRNELKAGIRE